MMTTNVPAADWPELPLAGWIDTRDTLHMWVQIVGKVRLRLTPPINHSWHSTLYLTARGLTTSPIPYGTRSFHIDFDFVDHRLRIDAHDGASGGFALEPQSVATFYARLMEELARLGLPVRISTRPNEVADATPFPRDETHRSYDRAAVHRFWGALLHADRVLKRFRTGFVGKCSPVHLFFGAMDLAVTRFSGRPAPMHPGGIPNLPDRVTREAYSHEVSSCGFWSGTPPIDYPAFYAYAYPQPEGFAAARVRPAAAFYSADFGEFILPYDAVRASASPDDTVIEFLESTYSAAADLGGWDRRALERGQISFFP
jgi:hypothetical protein